MACLSRFETLSVGNPTFKAMVDSFRLFKTIQRCGSQIDIVRTAGYSNTGLRLIGHVSNIRVTHA